MIALRTTRPGADRHAGQQHRVGHLGALVDVARPGESTDLFTVPPVTTTPGDRIELNVVIGSPAWPSTSFAGGCGP